MKLFTQNRRDFALTLPNNSACLIFGQNTQMRNSDVEHPFRQDSDFYYLTGLREPDAVALLLKDAEGRTEYVLFTLPKDPSKEIWTGMRVGKEKAVSLYGADRAFSLDEIAEQLPEMLEGKTLCIANAPKTENQLKLLFGREHHIICDQLAECRIIKSEDEIFAHRKAAEISAKAHKKVLRHIGPGVTEFELAARYEARLKKRGCNDVAYGSIFAAGDNACILHHPAGSTVLKNGQLLLTDAAGEYNYYAADITRTYPVNGKFSPEQRAIYDVVLAAQKAGIDIICHGVTFKEVSNAVLRKLVEGLIDLGLLSGTVDDNIKSETYKQFYPHGFGHWLGLDVHDVGKREIEGKSRILRPGMLLTVEPGIYIQPDNMNVDAKWRGIGVRIEDDILVTDKGCENLSKDAPKDPDVIESLMSKYRKEKTDKPKTVLHQFPLERAGAEVSRKTELKARKKKMRV